MLLFVSLPLRYRWNTLPWLQVVDGQIKKENKAFPAHYQLRGAFGC